MGRARQQQENGAGEGKVCCVSSRLDTLLGLYFYSGCFIAVKFGETDPGLMLTICFQG